jgi:addiction module HigA family antidote
MSTSKTIIELRRQREPTHPGAVLREDVLEPLGLTVTAAARHIGVTRKTLSALVNERAGVSSQMAIRIGLATNTSPESWLRMQMAFDLWHARAAEVSVKAFDHREAS